MSCPPAPACLRRSAGEHLLVLAQYTVHVSIPDYPMDLAISSALERWRVQMVREPPRPQRPVWDDAELLERFAEEDSHMRIEADASPHAGMAATMATAMPTMTAAASAKTVAVATPTTATAAPGMAPAADPPNTKSCGQDERFSA